MDLDLATGPLALLFGFIILIEAVLWFFVPFVILRINDQIKKQNQLLTEQNGLLRQIINPTLHQRR